MRAYVITCEEVPQSVEAASRCIASGLEFGVEVKQVRAVTPNDDPLSMFEARGWPRAHFLLSKYSKPLACMATLLSHHRLWQLCDLLGEPILVLEHDAVFVARPPNLTGICRGVCNLAHPSFGKWKTPNRGLGRLTSKHFFPGAHGYFIAPEGAKKLLDGMDDAQPTDVYLGRKRFPWLEEFYPWPIRCEDSFSTIQIEHGASAHHNKLEILDCW